MFDPAAAPQLQLIQVCRSGSRILKPMGIVAQVDELLRAIVGVEDVPDVAAGQGVPEPWAEK
ncbi:MAG TPA: hypothetical protein VMW51_05345 [Terriglobia bacterium]|nr:hypothetical protein [Terriglobia bacterium]